MKSVIHFKCICWTNEYFWPHAKTQHVYNIGKDANTLNLRSNVGPETKDSGVPLAALWWVMRHQGQLGYFSHTPCTLKSHLAWSLYSHLYLGSSECYRDGYGRKDHFPDQCKSPSRMVTLGRSIMAIRAFWRDPVLHPPARLWDWGSLWVTGVCVSCSSVSNSLRPHEL